MKTHGEIESAICEGVTRFEQDYMGRGPKDIHTHLLGDLLVVRLQGVLTAAEQQLVKSLSAEKGRDLLKQVRTHLIETARPVMEAMVQEITGVKVLSLHHDISTVTGEEVVLFTLAESPILRDARENEAVQRHLHDPCCADFLDDAVDAGAGPAKTPGQSFRRVATAMLLENLPLRLRRQGSVNGRKDRIRLLIFLSRNEKSRRGRTPAGIRPRRPTR